MKILKTLFWRGTEGSSLWQLRKVNELDEQSGSRAPESIGPSLEAQESQCL